MLRFGFEGDHIENVLWCSNDLQPLSTVKHGIILCGTNNLYKDPPHIIVDGITGKKCNNRKIVCSILPRDESWSVI